MSEKSFSCNVCDKVTFEKECAKVDYEDFYRHGYCIDCFFEKCCESDDEEQQECIFCGYSDGESYGECDACWAFFCKTCDEYEDERFVTETISPTFCTDQDACLKRRIKVLMAEPSRYRNSEDIEVIAKLETLS